MSVTAGWYLTASLPLEPSPEPTTRHLPHQPPGAACKGRPEARDEQSLKSRAPLQ